MAIKEAAEAMTTAREELRLLFPSGGPAYRAALAALDEQDARIAARLARWDLTPPAPTAGDPDPPSPQGRRRRRSTVAEQRAACGFDSEDDFQAAVVAEARAHGLRVESTLRARTPARVTHRGLPDVRWWHPLGGPVGYAELKMPGGTLSVDQARTLLELQRCTEPTPPGAGEGSGSGMPHPVRVRPLVFVWTPADWDEIAATFAAWTTRRST